MVRIKKELIAQMNSLGEASFPEECAGVLLGHFEEDGRAVSELFPVENAARPELRRTEFRISDADLLRAEAAAGRKSLEVVGFYHSHADYEALASRRDRAFAFPGLSYPIVSVIGGRAEKVRSFSFAGTGGFFENDFSEEEIVCL